MSVTESLAIRHVCLAGQRDATSIHVAVPHPYIFAAVFFDICRRRRRRWDGVGSFDRQPSERELMQIAATQRRGPC